MNEGMFEAMTTRDPLNENILIEQNVENEIFHLTCLYNNYSEKYLNG